MERIGLPPTRQAVRLFSRITPHVIGPHLPLIRKAFANPLALKRLSDTTCAIDEMMLRLCQYETFPLHWPLFRQLCRDRKTSDFSLGGITQFLDFFPDDGIGHRMRRRFRLARSVEDLNSAHRTARWLRGHWHGLFQPGVQDDLGNLTAPLPETESIRLLNRPQDLLNISSANDLCLEQYLHPITQGQYALYQVRHQGEFAVAGLRRTENGHWEIDQIKGAKNAEPSQALKDCVAAWHANHSLSHFPQIPPPNRNHPSGHNIPKRKTINRVMNHHPLKIDVRILNQGLPDPYRKSIPILTDENLECGHVEWSLFKNPKEQAHRHPEIVDKIRSHSIWPLALIESLDVCEDYRGRGYGRKGLRFAINAAEQTGAAFAFLKVGWAPSVDDPEAECAWKIRFFQSEGFELAARNHDYEPVLMFRPLALKSVYTNES